MAGYNKRETYTTTGAKTSLGDFGSDDVSYAVSDNGANSSVATVEVLIGEGWYADADYLIGKPRTFEGPIAGLRINITSLGTASSVYFDVRGVGRYG